MTDADPRIDRYFAKDRPWRTERLALRELLLSEGLSETLKWRDPCYVAHGGNIAIIGALKDHCVLSFFKGVLLTDPKGLLVPPGDNSRSARVLRVLQLDDVTSHEQAIRALVRQAVENERLGRTVTFAKDDLATPEEVTDALAQDADLRAAFDALPRAAGVDISSISQARSSPRRSAPRRRVRTGSRCPRRSP